MIKFYFTCSLIFILALQSRAQNNAKFNKPIKDTSILLDTIYHLIDTVPPVGIPDSSRFLHSDLNKFKNLSDSAGVFFDDYLKTKSGGKFNKDLPGQVMKGDLSIDAIPVEYFQKTPLDSLQKFKLKAKDFQDADQLQKAFGSELQQELGGETIPFKTDIQKSAIAKRVLSLRDREVVDSIRSLGKEKLYSIRDEVQDSVGLYVLSEKKKLKENLFFEGLVSTESTNGDLSVSDFSGSLGVRLRKYYEVGMGPEIGVSGNDFSAIGARLFARRRIFEDKLFAIVENSFRKQPDFGETVPNVEGMTSNLKLGAGRMFNLSPDGHTRLNVQTLMNPQYLKSGHSSLIDFRFGISKLSRK